MGGQLSLNCFLSILYVRTWNFRCYNVLGLQCIQCFLPSVQFSYKYVEIFLPCPYPGLALVLIIELLHFPRLKLIFNLKELVMPDYFVNKNAQDNGDHEVHTTGCDYMPLNHNRIFLGDFATCQEAVVEAKKTYPVSNGCAYCSNECHTR